MDLAGRKVIVTGAARGCGAASARACASAGADVVLLDVDDGAGEALASRMRDGAGRTLYLHCDVSDREMVDNTFAEGCSFLGGVDTLVHVAGITCGWQPAEVIDAETWDRVFSVNVKGTIHVNQAACRLMKDAGYGKIINFAGSAGVTGAPGGGPYSASKGAVIALSRTVAREWGRYGIRVNVVNPMIETPLRYETYRASRDVPPEWLPDDDAYASAFLVRGASGLKGDPDVDLGPVIVFLASSASDFITGQMYNIDGGILMNR